AWVLRRNNVGAHGYEAWNYHLLMCNRRIAHGACCNKKQRRHRQSTPCFGGAFLASWLRQVRKAPEPAQRALVYYQWERRQICSDEFFLHPRLPARWQWGLLSHLLRRHVIHGAFRSVFPASL